MTDKRQERGTRITNTALDKRVRELEASHANLMAELIATQARATELEHAMTALLKTTGPPTRTLGPVRSGPATQIR